MMKYVKQIVRIVLSMLIAFCITACWGFKEIVEGSLDLGKLKFSGSSYDNDDEDATDGLIGFNLAYLMVFAPPAANEKSFLQLPSELSKSQLAYAGTPGSWHALGMGKNNNRRLSSYQASANEFVDHLRLMTGLEFVQKNSKSEGTKVILNYLQVPVLALYNYDLNGDSKIFGGFGPYLAYGVGGKFKGDGFNEKAFDKDFGFKRFDFGLTFTAGYKFNKKWSVRLGYDLGLVNIEQNDFDKAKNRCISLSIGYWPELISKLVKN